MTEHPYQDIEDAILEINAYASKLDTLTKRLEAIHKKCSRCHNTGILEVTDWTPDGWVHAFCDCEIGRVKGLEDV